VNYFKDIWIINILYRLREKDSRVEFLRQIINENELEKQEMKIIVEETLAKYSN